MQNFIIKILVSPHQNIFVGTKKNLLIYGSFEQSKQIFELMGKPRISPGYLWRGETGPSPGFGAEYRYSFIILKFHSLVI